MKEDFKPAILGGNCEFCGIPAKDCPHHKDSFLNKPEEIPQFKEYATPITTETASPEVKEEVPATTGDGKEEMHELTKEELEMNPGFKDAGLEVGDKIGIPQEMDGSVITEDEKLPSDVEAMATDNEAE